MEDKNERLVTVRKFAEECSANTLGDLELAHLNTARNSHHDFQSQVQAVLQAILKIADNAEKWAQAEAEARYVSYIRQHELLKRDAQVVEAKRIVGKRQKLLTK